LKTVNFLFRWHILLAIASVLITVSAQIQLGLRPEWQPWLFLIFIGTLFEYNKNRASVLFVSTETIHSVKPGLIHKTRRKLYLTASILGAGFVVAVFYTKTNVLLTFLLLGFVTLFYSGIGSRKNKYIFNLREIPYLKIFLISLIWSVSTVLLPVIHTGNEIINTKVFILFAERFLFIFTIAIQFDIRDMQADRRAGLKTIPLLIEKKKASLLSLFSLFLCFAISVFHYLVLNEWLVLVAVCISLSATALFIRLQFFKNMGRYYYQVLDGTLLLQGLLVLGFYYLKHFSCSKQFATILFLN